MFMRWVNEILQKYVCMSPSKLPWKLSLLTTFWEEYTLQKYTLTFITRSLPPLDESDMKKKLLLDWMQLNYLKSKPILNKYDSHKCRINKSSLLVSVFFFKKKISNTCFHQKILCLLLSCSLSLNYFLVMGLVLTSCFYWFPVCSFSF